MDDALTAAERQLVPVWSYKLVALSYLISWLGAYTSTQIIIHAKYSRTSSVRWLWTFLASVAFGFSAIWCMHFVGMLACGLDVKVSYNKGLTVLSALVAVLFTFAAFCSGYATEAIENSAPVRVLSRIGRFLREVFRSVSGGRPQVDPEAGYSRVASTETSEDGESRSRRNSTSDRGDGENAEGEGPRRPYLPEDMEEEPTAWHGSNAYEAIDASEPAEVRAPTTESVHHPSASSATLQSVRHPSPPPTKRMSSGESGTSEESSPLTTSSDEDSTFDPRTTNTHGTVPTLATRTWSDPLHAGLSREARLRIKAHARDKPVPQFGWKYWMKAYYSSVTFLAGFRAAIWGLAIVFMHYCGMWAMHIPEGRIEWNWGVVILSYVVAFTVCFVGCVAMVHMEVDFGRQVLFATIASVGVCSMHYTGMQAATFYTRSPPSSERGYPEFLPFTILSVAVFVCVISNAVLAHSAIISRNRMAEVILTKRRFWRVMAEKEAAEQANELKQQFISVASHEIRTPLHAVNGYCELLAMTDLTEEQAMYVSSIQQACHAINVIAGNVLDFSKLDRNNVELSARPVLVDLRKMVEDQARIIETRTSPSPQSSVDVIVSVAPDVPASVYLDETYTYRILMNLLSNAQKFCEEGYICVSVGMDSESHVVIKISDTGCGIPKSFRGALFQPFRQADSSLTRPKQGTGLGLSIVKHLVQRMSGTIDVESVEGEGSVFTVKIPVTVPTNSPPNPVPPLSTGKRIKVVHRDERTAQFYTDEWTKYGFRATHVPGTTALSDLVKDADIIWADFESATQAPALREILHADPLRNLPPLFVVYADAKQLTSEPALSTRGSSILVKRPVVVHSLLDMLQNPERHMGKHVVLPSRVRFDLPLDKMLLTPLEERKESNVFQPVAPPTPPPIPQSRPKSPEGSHKDKVLLVEDNLVNQHLGKRLLEKLGYEVVTASNGQEAVDQIQQQHSFHCCFMDCQMPVLDGFAATSKIRELENNGTVQGRIPIIALTANVSSESEERCRAAGMDHFLPKPFKISDLRATLAQLRETT